MSTFAHLALDPSDPRVSGGAELQVALLSKELVCRGHEVTILGADEGQTRDRILDGIRCCVAGRFHTGGLGDTLSAIGPVFAGIRAARPDYVFILGWTSWLALLLLARWTGAVKVGFICGLDTEVNGEFRRQNPVRGALFEFGMRHCDLRFAMSEYQRERFREMGLACGFYRNLIRKHERRPDVAKDIDFLWIARGRAIKRPHLFLDLAAELAGQRCVMICPNQDAELWRSLASRASKIGHVEFSDGVPYHCVQEYYDRARVFVSTSEVEGFPNSFIQAAMGGAAILSLEVDPDGVLARYGGGVVAQSEENLLAEAKALAASPERVASIGRRAPMFVNELLDNSRNVQAFLDGLAAQS